MNAALLFAAALPAGPALALALNAHWTRHIGRHRNP